MALSYVHPYPPHIAQQLDFQACEYLKFIPLVGFASHLKVSDGHKNLSKPLGILSKRSVFRACNLNTLPFFFLLMHLESFFSQVVEWQKSSQTV